jgi:cell division septal protein FtsQ
MLGFLLRRRIRSKKGRDRARKRFKISIIFFCFALLVLFGVAIYLFHNERVVIQSIIVRGASVLDGSDIKKVTEKYLDGAYLYLFPKRSVFLYPKNQIASALLSDFARIEKVTVESEDLRTLVVTISERQPYALWCGDILDTLYSDTSEEKIVLEGELRDDERKEAERCLVLDKGGIIYAYAPDDFTLPYIVFEGMLEVDDPIGTQFLTKDEFGNIATLLSAIKSIGILPKRVQIADKHDFSVVLEENTKLKFRRDDDFSQVFANLEASFISKEIDTDNLENIEYIDLRFGNRLYVKDR